MHTARSSATSAPNAAVVIWERRRHAAWIDYLATTQDAPRTEYEHVEANAWEQLRRRLRRNDELLLGIER